MAKMNESVAGSTTTRVLVLDFDSGVVGDALARAEGFDLQVVRSFTDAAGVFTRFKPDVLLLTFGEPRDEQVALLRELTRREDAVPMLVVSRPVDERRVTEVIKAGAGGYLFAEDSDSVPTALRELMRGGVPMSAPVSRLVLGRARRSSAEMRAVRPGPTAEKLLTRRQQEILKLLSKGMSYEDVGVALGLSLNTVRTHVRAIYEKLGANTKVEAVMLGIELGLLPRTPPPR